MEEASALQAWIGVATRGLSDDAATRVGAEIRDHYLAALDEAVAAGLDPNEAELSALARLGDPRVAGRAFRRSNLRRWEARVVEDLGKPPSRLETALFVAFVPLFILLGVKHLDGPIRTVAFGFCLLSMIAGILARFSIRRLLARKGRLRAALLADTLGNWTIFAALCVGSAFLHDGLWPRVNALVYLAILFVVVVYVAHLWPKLGARTPRPR